MFEIVRKDGMGRIGILYTKSGKVETPAVMPVINPRKQIISPEEMRRIGAEIVITNAYIIWRDEKMRDAAMEEGIKEVVGWDGVLMTDSGAYQLASYGRIEVENDEIIRFQEDIGADIGSPLDIPTSPDASEDKARAEGEESVRRYCGGRSLVKNMVLCAPIQGGGYEEVRAALSRELRKLDPEIYAIGGVVPLLERYEFGKLVNLVMACKRELPPAPVHLFGVGHPMVFSLAVAMGCDLFDSAAYALYASDGRYLTPTGTIRVEELKHLPCTCPVCKNAQPGDLEDEKALAMHNLYATFEEIRRVKQSICDGSLLDLVEIRCRSHPRLVDGYRMLMRNSELIERYDPVGGCTFVCSPEGASRPEVLRYMRMIERIKLAGKVLVTTKREREKGYNHILFFKPPFGAYPPELEFTYPIGQSEICESDEIKREGLRNLLKLIRMNQDATFTFKCPKDWRFPEIEEIKEVAEVDEI